MRSGPEAAESGAIPGRWEDIKSHFGFGSCALVGNSGALRGATWGPAIDTHQAVLRLNQAPVSGYQSIVGAKTTFRILNNKWVEVRVCERVCERAAADKNKVPTVVRHEDCISSHTGPCGIGNMGRRACSIRSAAWS